MRKEIIFAVIFGIAFGTIVALGFLRANNAINNTAETFVASTQKTYKDQIENQNESLTLIKPNDQQVVIDDPAIISGITKANSYVIATNGTTDVFSKTADGSFEIEMDLEPAINRLSLFTLTGQLDMQNRFVEVLYSSEFSKQIVINAGEESVEEKLEKVRTSYLFYKGTITDIANGSIQIRSDNEEIKYLSIDEENTTFAKLGPQSQSLKYSDLAIGDYILALGYVNDKEVLVTLRILVTSAQAEKEVRVLYATADSLTRSSVTFISADNQLFEMLTSKTTVYTDGDINDPDKSAFSDLEKGCEVLLTYTQTGEDLTIRKLHILSYPETPEAPPEE